MQDRVGGVLTRLPGLKAAGGKLKALLPVVSVGQGSPEALRGVLIRLAPL